MWANAHASAKGMVTGEPHTPVRHTWAEVHEQARRTAGGRRRRAWHTATPSPCWRRTGRDRPDRTGVWMRGASLTMLHQPTPRTDLARWARRPPQSSP
jgi:fatty-acyl-CoA synthase